MPNPEGLIVLLVGMLSPTQVPTYIMRIYNIQVIQTELFFKSQFKEQIEYTVSYKKALT